MEILLVVATVMMLGLWFSSSIDKKEKTKKHQRVGDEFRHLMDDLNLSGDDRDMPDGFLDWLRLKEDSLEYVKDLRRLLNEDEKKVKVLSEITRIQRGYLEEQQSINEHKRWYSYVKSFQEMNKAQQKHEIERLKSSNKTGYTSKIDKLNALELIYLGNDSKTTDVLIGGVKLFTLKEK